MMNSDRSRMMRDGTPYAVRWISAMASKTTTCQVNQTMVLGESSQIIYLNWRQTINVWAIVRRMRISEDTCVSLGYEES